MADKIKKKQPGRPKKRPEQTFEELDEQNTNKLEMSQTSNSTSKSSATDNPIITIDDLGAQYKKVFNLLADASLRAERGTRSGNLINHTAYQYNKLNPFLQNQRLKELYSQPCNFDKVNINDFLSNPGASEEQLRSLAWSQSGLQQIYYNILRRAADIPLYKYFVTPPYLSASEYKSEKFKDEDALLQDWLSVFNVPATFKTIALQVKREGKQTYLLRNKFNGDYGRNKRTVFATLQKLPTDWIKITGIGQRGYTVSFNMMYFMNIANSVSDYGDFFIKAWQDLTEKGVVCLDQESGQYNLMVDKAVNYSFTYHNKKYNSILETEVISQGSKKKKNSQLISYMFWLKLPDDICFTFASDNSTPWVVPDTIGLLQKLQELSDYSKLAGLIASTPLTAVLTGEIETINSARAGKNESVFSPEVIQGYQDLFNAATSTNVEAWMWPARNIKLQQLNADVNSSDIVTKATQNFITNSGEGGLTITTDKPNVSQVKTAQLLAASQQNYVTIQFERALNFIIQHKLGFEYDWTVHIWGDIFSFDSEKKYLKELVAGGASFLLPKLASAEGISLRDTKATMEYLKSLDFYKDFSTWTSIAAAVAADKQSNSQTQDVGRPSLDEGEIENEATAASRAAGDNTADNRDTLSKKEKCPICGDFKEEDQVVCDVCAAQISEYNDFGE